MNYSWKLVRFERETGCKMHFCPVELVQDLIADLQNRGLYSVSDDGALVCLIDMPGPISRDRGWEEVKLPNFTLKFPTLDFELFMKLIEDAPERAFATGQKYYKIHGHGVCIVFTPELRDQTLIQMELMLPVVTIRAKEEADKFSAAIRGINEKGHVRLTDWRK